MTGKLQLLPHVVPSVEHCVMYPVALVIEFHVAVNVLPEVTKLVIVGLPKAAVFCVTVLDQLLGPSELFALTLK